MEKTLQRCRREAHQAGLRVREGFIKEGAIGMRVGRGTACSSPHEGGGLTGVKDGTDRSGACWGL